MDSTKADTSKVNNAITEQQDDNDGSNPDQNDSSYSSSSDSDNNLEERQAKLTAPSKKSSKKVKKNVQEEPDSGTLPPTYNQIVTLLNAQFFTINSRNGFVAEDLNQNEVSAFLDGIAKSMQIDPTNIRNNVVERVKLTDKLFRYFYDLAQRPNEDDDLFDGTGATPTVHPASELKTFQEFNPSSTCSTFPAFFIHIIGEYCKNYGNETSFNMKNLDIVCQNTSKMLKLHKSVYESPIYGSFLGYMSLIKYDSKTINYKRGTKSVINNSILDLPPRFWYLSDELSNQKEKGSWNSVTFVTNEDSSFKLYDIVALCYFLQNDSPPKFANLSKILHIYIPAKCAEITANVENFTSIDNNDSCDFSITFSTTKYTKQVPKQSLTSQSKDEEFFSDNLLKAENPSTGVSVTGVFTPISVILNYRKKTDTFPMDKMVTFDNFFDIIKLKELKSTKKK